MRSSAWTTTEEYEYLNGYIPRFLKQQETRVLSHFLAEVTIAFLDKFPSRRKEYDRESMLRVSHIPPCPLHSLILFLSL